MKKLFVRINPRVPAERRFRGTFEFSKDWREVEVDEATAAAIAADQMLESREADPSNAPAEAPKVESDADSPAPAASPAARPEEKAVRLEEIAAAARELPQEIASNWTSKGSPKTEVLEAVLGYVITAAERDAAWKIVMAEGRVQASGVGDQASETPLTSTAPSS